MCCSSSNAHSDGPSNSRLALVEHHLPPTARLPELLHLPSTNTHKIDKMSTGTCKPVIMKNCS